MNFRPEVVAVAVIALSVVLEIISVLAVAYIIAHFIQKYW